MDDCPFPIWAIFITVDTKNPGTYRPWTYRVPFWEGRAIVCCSTSTTSSLHNSEVTFWSANEDLTVVWSSIRTWDWWGVSVVNEIATASWDWKISHYQPSITAYVWKRVNNTNDFNPYSIPDAYDPSWDVFPKNVIIDAQTLWPQQPDPYNPQ